MHGCPNRCLHCWLGHGTNGRMVPDDLRFAAKAFRPFAQNLKISSWYREPEFADDYKALWVLETELSDKPEPHYALMSIWRAARDPDYIPWLASVGMDKCQLTLFGGEALTDKYTGRRGAYQDILRSIEQLKANGIAPRLQAFVNQETIHEMQHIDELITRYNIEYAFAHQGSCTGAGAALYPLWPTQATLAHMPPLLTELSLKHWQANSLTDIFGEPEAVLYDRLCNSHNTHSFVCDDPVFFVDRNWDVYPNLSAPAPQLHLGNLKRDSAQTIIEAYRSEISPAQAARRNIPLGEMIRACGNPVGQGLFVQDDYEEYILERYLNYTIS